MKRRGIVARIPVVYAFVFLVLIPVSSFIPGISSFTRPLYAAEHPDKLYAEGKYKDAEEAYRKLDMDRPGDLKFRYNRGCAAFQAGSLDAAHAAFTSVVRRSTDDDMRFRGLYNLGNTAYKQGDFAQAGEYYKQALQLRPNDADAGHNLELSLKALKKQQESSENKKQEGGSQKDNSRQQGESSRGNGPDSRDKGQGENPDGRQSGQPQKPEGKGAENKGGASGKEPDQDRGSSSGRQKEPGEGNQDLNGELKGKNMGTATQAQNTDRAGDSAALMERRKAEALLDNISEDRARMNRLQGIQGGRSAVGSGKEW